MFVFYILINIPFKENSLNKVIFIKVWELKF